MVGGFLLVVSWRTGRGEF